MIKDVWCNVVVPIVVAIEVKNDEEDAFAKTEAMFMEGELDDKVITSFKEGNAVIEWQEHDEIVEN